MMLRHWVNLALALALVLPATAFAGEAAPASDRRYYGAARKPVAQPAALGLPAREPAR